MLKPSVKASLKNKRNSRFKKKKKMAEKALGSKMLRYLYLYELKNSTVKDLKGVCDLKNDCKGKDGILCGVGNL